MLPKRKSESKGTQAQTEPEIIPSHLMVVEELSQRLSELNAVKSKPEPAFIPHLGLLADTSKLLKVTAKFDRYLSDVDNLNEIRCSPQKWAEMKEFNSQLILIYVGSLTHDAMNVFAEIKVEQFLLKQEEQVTINPVNRKWNELSNYVRHNILSIEDHTCRQMMIERWIMIAMILHLSGNFFSAQAIVLGMMQPEVCRLIEQEDKWVGLSATTFESMKILFKFYNANAVSSELRYNAMVSFKGPKLPTLELITKKLGSQFDVAVADALSLCRSLQKQAEASEKITTESRSDATLKRTLKHSAMQTDNNTSNHSTIGRLFRRSSQRAITADTDLQASLHEAEMDLNALLRKREAFAVDTFAMLYVRNKHPVPTHLISFVLLGAIQNGQIHTNEELVRLRRLSDQYRPPRTPIQVNEITTSLLDDLIVPTVLREIQGRVPLWQYQLIAKLKWLLSPEILDLWGAKLDSDCRKKVNKIYQCVINDTMSLDEIIDKVISLIKPDSDASKSKNVSGQKAKRPFFKRLSLSNNPDANFLIEVCNVLSQGGGLHYHECMQRLDSIACKIRADQMQSNISLRASH